MSRDRRVATYFFDSQVVWICSVRSSKAMSIDRPLRAPIQVSRRSLCSSAASQSLFTIIYSITLSIVLRRAISLYTPRSLYVAFPSFFRTIIFASRSLSRQQPSLQQLVASFAIATAIGFPIALRNSIGTPSGPSAFPDFCLFIAWRASVSGVEPLIWARASPRYQDQTTHVYQGPTTITY